MMQKNIIKSLLRVWTKAVDQNKGWCVGRLKTEIGSTKEEYCLIGVLGCNKGFNIRGNICVDKNGYEMRYTEILLSYKIPLKQIVQKYECHICGIVNPLSRMIPHLNDKHDVNFEKALKEVPKLKIVKGEISYREIISLKESPYISEEDKQYLKEQMAIITHSTQ